MYIAVKNNKVTDRNTRLEYRLRNAGISGAEVGLDLRNSGDNASTCWFNNELDENGSCTFPLAGAYRIKGLSFL